MVQQLRGVESERQISQKVQRAQTTAAQKARNVLDVLKRKRLLCEEHCAENLPSQNKPIECQMSYKGTKQRTEWLMSTFMITGSFTASYFYAMPYELSDSVILTFQLYSLYKGSFCNICFLLYTSNMYKLLVLHFYKMDENKLFCWSSFCRRAFRHN